MELEWRAWGNVVVELNARGVDMNEHPDVSAALRRWGEELVALRVTQPEHVRGEVLNDVRGQYPALAVLRGSPAAQRWQRE